MNKLIDKVITYYKLDNLIENPIQLTGGITNKTYMFTTSKSKYVVKILTSDNIEALEKSEQIASIAKSNDIKVLCAIKNKKFINNICKKNVVLYKYYDGKILLTKELTLKHIEKLAVELSKLHNIKCTDKNMLKYDKNDYDTLYNLSLNSNESCFNYLKNNIEMLNSIYIKVYDSYLKLTNQVSYIHRDYNRKNILWKDNDFRIIDWETSCVGNPSIDFFNSLWFLTNDYEEEKLKTFASAYFKNMHLLDDYEVGAYAALIEECNWLYFSLNRAFNIKDTYEVELGKNSIENSLREIINCYNKIESMLKIIKNL